MKYTSKNKKKCTKQHGNVVEYLIEYNYEANYLIEKIGLNGSLMDLIIYNTPVQVVGEFAYDWFLRKMIYHKFDLTSNS